MAVSQDNQHRPPSSSFGLLDPELPEFSNLYISVKTVETHRRSVMVKLGIDSIAELTKFAIRKGLTSLEN